MKVLFLTSYFPPEVGAVQTRTHEMAVRLVRMGHEVSVLTTFPNYPTGIVPKEWRGHLFMTRKEDGLTVHRTWSYTAPNRGFLNRVASHLSFAIAACVWAPRVPRPDVLIVESHPLFNGWAGIFLSIVKRAPYLLNVSDLWPESAVQLGVLKNKTIIRLAKSMELLFYRRAEKVLAMTAGIQKAVVKDGIDPSKVVLFRNGVDSEFFRPGVDGFGLRERLGIPADAFVILYAGNLGLANNVDLMLDTAALSQQHADTNIRFVIAGDGGERERLKARAQELQLRNLSFVATIQKPDMPALLNGANCVLVSLRDLELFHGALPTKMFEAMACAKPVVLAVAGEAAELICEADAGLCVKPNDAEAVRNAILSLRNDPTRAAEMGRNGRLYVSAHFHRDTRALELHNCMMKAARAA